MRVGIPMLLNLPFLFSPLLPFQVSFFLFQTFPAGALDLTDLKGQQLNLVLDLKHTLSQANKLISLCSL